VWPDGWVGPTLRLNLEALGGERRLRLLGTAVWEYLGAPLELHVRINTVAAGKARVEDGMFAVEIALPATAAAGRLRVEIEASPHFVPDTILGNSDQRRLCWLIQTVELSS